MMTVKCGRPRHRAFGIATIFVSILLASSCLLLPGGAVAQKSDAPEREFEDFNRDNFDRSTKIDNPWFPLKPGMRWVHTGSTTERGKRVGQRLVFRRVPRGILQRKDDQGSGLDPRIERVVSGDHDAGGAAARYPQLLSGVGPLGHVDRPGEGGPDGPEDLRPASLLRRRSDRGRDHQGRAGRGAAQVLLTRYRQGSCRLERSRRKAPRGPRADRVHAAQPGGLGRGPRGGAETGEER